MKIHDKISTIAGGIYGFFFYIKFIYGDWDFIILWAGNIAFFLGFFLAWRDSKKQFTENKKRVK